MNGKFLITNHPVFDHFTSASQQSVSQSFSQSINQLESKSNSHSFIRESLTYLVIPSVSQSTNQSDSELINHFMCFIYYYIILLQCFSHSPKILDAWPTALRPIAAMAAILFTSAIAVHDAQGDG